VHGVVHGDEDNAGVLVRVAKPGEQEDSHVVVPGGEGGREEGREGGPLLGIRNMCLLSHSPSSTLRYKIRSCGVSID